MRKGENQDDGEQWQNQISFSNNLVRLKSLNSVETGGQYCTKVGNSSKGGSERSESLKTRRDTLEMN